MLVEKTDHRHMAWLLNIGIDAVPGLYKLMEEAQVPSGTKFDPELHEEVVRNGCVTFELKGSGEKQETYLLAHRLQAV